MNVIKSALALAVVAGFASASFAEGTAPTTKATASTPAAVEKQAEAPKPAEPVKAQAAKAATPAKVEIAKTETAKSEGAAPDAKPVKAQHPANKVEHKTESPAPAAK